MFSDEISKLFFSLYRTVCRHFTIRGAEGTDFEGGIYHGRILLPPEYPFKPPHIMFLTPSGRFETNNKVCLSFSAYHPELWQPAWGIRLILEALISFLPTPGGGAIGALNWSSAERKRLAAKSQSFCCPTCGKIADLFPKIEQKKKSSGPSRFEKEIQKLQELQTAAHHKKEGEDENGADDKKEEDGPKSISEGDNTEEGNMTSIASSVETKTHVENGIPADDRVSSRPAPAETPLQDESPREPEPNTRVIPNTTETVELPNEDRQGSALLSNGVLQTAISILLVASILMFRKVLRIIDEIQELEEL